MFDINQLVQGFLRFLKSCYYSFYNLITSQTSAPAPAPAPATQPATSAQVSAAQVPPLAAEAAISAIRAVSPNASVEVTQTGFVVTGVEPKQCDYISL